MYSNLESIPDYKDIVRRQFETISLVTSSMPTKSAFYEQCRVSSCKSIAWHCLISMKSLLSALEMTLSRGYLHQTS